MLTFCIDTSTFNGIESLLYHLAMKAKTGRDGQSHTYSKVRVGVLY
jgi:hypothetical protein